MLKKLMSKKQNNKGFSLVELIVVVLIIAIIAVALAPQVMRWVGTSRINVDQNNAATLKSAMHAGIADYMAQNKVYTITNTGTANTIINGTAPGAGALGDAQAAITQAVNDEWPESEASNHGFRVNITTAGGVTVEYSDSTGASPNWVMSK